jgi:hypothetical protein
MLHVNTPLLHILFDLINSQFINIIYMTRANARARYLVYANIYIYKLLKKYGQSKINEYYRLIKISLIKWDGINILDETNNIYKYIYVKNILRIRSNM